MKQLYFLFFLVSYFQCLSQPKKYEFKLINPEMSMNVAGQWTEWSKLDSGFTYMQMVVIDFENKQIAWSVNNKAPERYIITDYYKDTVIQDINLNKLIVNTISMKGEKMKINLYFLNYQSYKLGMLVTDDPNLRIRSKIENY